MTGDLISTRVRHARGLFEGLPATYDLMARLLSFGQDPRWRRFMVSRVGVGPAARVLDVATGTGAVAMSLAERTGASVVGLDQSVPMVLEGIRRVSGSASSGRVRFVLGHGEQLPFPDEAFDAVTFTYLLRYVDDVAAAVGELARVLRPGGILASLEFHVPDRAPWRILWRAYTRLGLPGLGWLASRRWYEVGRFLGESIPRFYSSHPLPAQLEMWRAAGIPDVRSRLMSLGGAVVIWGTKRGR